MQLHFDIVLIVTLWLGLKASTSMRRTANIKDIVLIRMSVRFGCDVSRTPLNRICAVKMVLRFAAGAPASLSCC
jgi:hypothetical protein